MTKSCMSFGDTNDRKSSIAFVVLVASRSRSWQVYRENSMWLQPCAWRSGWMKVYHRYCLSTQHSQKGSHQEPLQLNIQISIVIDVREGGVESTAYANLLANMAHYTVA